MGLFVKKSNTNQPSDWVSFKKLYVKSNSGWTIVKKVFVKTINTNDETYILNYLGTIYYFELIIFVDSEEKITNSELLDLISKLQAKRDDLIFLKDHPEDPGFINGVNTGNGRYPIILAQPRNKLPYQVLANNFRSNRYACTYSPRTNNFLINTICQTTLSSLRNSTLLLSKISANNSQNVLGLIKKAIFT